MNIKIVLLSSLFLFAGITQCDNSQTPPAIKLEEIKISIYQYIQLTETLENSSEQKNYDNALAERQKCSANLIEEINKCRATENCSNLQNAFYAFNKAELETYQEWNNLQNSECQKKLIELQKQYQ